MNTLSSLLNYISSFEPLGSIKMYGGASAPSKWLLCDGRAISRTTYAKLFAVIGTRYGIGDGSSTFNLPDFRGRTAIGAGTGTSSDATQHDLGTVGGEETHKLTVDELAKHSHGLPHPMGYVNSAPGGNGTYGAVTTWYETNEAGQDTPHNNMQPFTTVNYIIFAGV